MRVRRNLDLLTARRGKTVISLPHSQSEYLNSFKNRYVDLDTAICQITTLSSSALLSYLEGSARILRKQLKNIIEDNENYKPEIDNIKEILNKQKSEECRMVEVDEEWMRQHPNVQTASSNAAKQMYERLLIHRLGEKVSNWMKANNIQFSLENSKRNKYLSDREKSFSPRLTNVSNLKTIPLYIKMNPSSRVVKACSIDEATAVYVGTYSSDQLEVLGTYECLSLFDSKTGFRHLYVSSEADILSMPEWMRFKLSCTYNNRMFIGFPGCQEDLLATIMKCKGHCYTIKDNVWINSVVSLARKKELLKQLLNLTENQFVPSKIGSNHIRYVKWCDILKTVPLWPMVDSAPRIIQFLLTASNISEAFACGLILFMTSVEKEELIILDASPAWSCVNSSDWYKFVKSCSGGFKMSQNLFGFNFTKWFELEVLVNRGEGTIDWKQEEINRTSGLKVTTHTKEYVYKASLKLFEQFKDKGLKPRAISKDSYIATRYEWCPMGAVHSQYNDKEILKDQDYLAQTKLHLLSAWDAKKMRSIFERPPANESWPIVKYEWGKERALYSSDITNFIITNFVMYGCENVFDHRFPMGRNAEANFVRQKAKAVLDCGASYCLDFEDHNSQHSISTMQAIIQAYLEVFSADLHIEQRYMGEWLINSIAKQYINFPDHRVHVAGTLFTGWRLTAFINTVTNWIYSGEVIEELGLASCHNGDDSLIAVEKFSTISQLAKFHYTNGVRVQHSKSFLASIGEFLRVDHKRGAVGTQYLSRGIATLVYGRIESSTGLNLLEMTSSFMKRVEEAVGRGFNQEMAVILLNHYLDWVSKSTKTDINILKAYLESHVVVGGYRTDTEAAVDVQFKLEKGLRQNQYDNNIKFDERRYHNAVNDYVGWIKQRYPGMEAYIGSLKHELSSVYQQVFPVRDATIRCEPVANTRQAMSWRSLYKRDSKTLFMSKDILYSLKYNIPFTGLNSERFEEVRSSLSMEFDLKKAIQVLY